MPGTVVKSASRAIHILELFAVARAPLRLHDIRMRLDYPQSSTTALLKSLVGEGYLNYDRVGRTYFPTMRVNDLGDWIGEHIYQDGRLLGDLNALASNFGESVVLVAQNDLFAHYVHTVDSCKDQASHVVPGHMRPLPRSSAGIALLSRMSDYKAERVCRSLNVREPDRGQRIDLAAVGAAIGEARTRGYAILHGAMTLDHATATISVPLPTARHGVPLAVSICGPDHRMLPMRERIVAGLKDVAARMGSAA